MDVMDVLRKQMETTGFQLTKVFEGLDESTADHKANEHMMSGRETLAHLIEVCHAAQKHMRGEEHAWGSFQPADTSYDALSAEFAGERAKTVEAILSGAPEAAFHVASDYMVIHEAYHVGQMASNRLSQNNGWNPYSLYGG